MRKYNLYEMITKSDAIVEDGGRVVFYEKEDDGSVVLGIDYDSEVLYSEPIYENNTEYADDNGYFTVAIGGYDTYLRFYVNAPLGEPNV